MKLREQMVGRAQAGGPQTSVMMTLAAFAAIDAAEVDKQFTTELLEQATLTDLRRAMQQSKTNWSPVWVGISAQGGANMAYIAQNQADPQQYAVVIRGTDFGIGLDMLEDMNVQTTQDFKVGNNTVQIASGTATAHDLLIGAQGTNGNMLLQELEGLAGAGEGAATIFVTGHSLGGALATTVALYLQNALQSAAFQVYTFAGPSAGLTDFASLFDSTFPASSAGANSSWRVYNAWDIVPQAWERDTLQAIVSWYPPPGPAQSPEVQPIVRKIINKPDGLQYQQPSVNPCALNEQDWASAHKDSQSVGFLDEVGFQHDNNTYLYLLGAPTVAMVGSLSPNKMLRGMSRTVDLTGLGFTPGTGVSFSGDGVTVNRVSFESQSKLKVDVSVAGKATPGPRDVMVSQAGGTIAGGTSAFFVDEL